MASFNSASLSASYQILNVGGFAQDVKILKIYNGSTNGVTISFDGINDHDYLPNGSNPFILELQSNHACNSSYGSGTLCGRQGQLVYGKGTAGTGLIYIAGYR